MSPQRYALYIVLQLCCHVWPQLCRVHQPSLNTSLPCCPAGVKSSVTIPRPIPGLVSSTVLVESFEAGRSVAAFMKEPAAINTQIVALGVDAYLKMLLTDNFVHTDLHPGEGLWCGGDRQWAVGTAATSIQRGAGLGAEVQCGMVSINASRYGRTGLLCVWRVELFVLGGGRGREKHSCQQRPKGSMHGNMVGEFRFMQALQPPAKQWP
jgi:hypothetical protein